MENKRASAPKTNRTKRKKDRSKRTIAMIVIVNILVVLLVAVSVYKIYAYFFHIGISTVQNKAAGGVYTEVQVVIPEGSTTTDIAEILAKSGLIENPVAFRVKCKTSGVSGEFYAGTYTLNNQMDFGEIVERLQTIAPTDDDSVIKFLVPEGATVKVIADKLESQDIVTAQDFIDASNKTDFNYDFIAKIPARDYRLEGYLFPDTYFLQKGMTSDEIINKMLSRFQQIYAPYAEAATKRNLSTDEVLTMASIIEGEVRNPDERAVVASVINNRLQDGMKLQMDSTVLYAMGKYKERIYENDTKVESPYNTYYVKGLPKGPIGNPGEACIQAVLHPKDTNYLYYVLQDVEAGTHYFTKDYDDFLKAKAKYTRTLS